MKVYVRVGDVLEAEADVLISSANPWLNMSGGVNGAIRERCPEIQSELHSHMKSLGASAVSAGSVVRTSAASLQFEAIIHAVAIDPFYDSSMELVSNTLKAVFSLAEKIGARSVVLPALATGYGPLTMNEFGQALAVAMKNRHDINELTVVVRREEDAEAIRSALAE